MCREGQFEHGKELAVGVALEAMLGKENYQFTIGKSETVYTGKVVEMLDIGTTWTNSEGIDVVIIPVRICDNTIEAQ